MMEDIMKKHKEHFDKVRKIKFKNENESYKYDEKFNLELSQYIKKRIKELEIVLDKKLL